MSKLDEKSPEQLRAECTHHYVIHVTQEGVDARVRGMGFRVGATAELSQENIHKMVYARALSMGWPQDLPIKITVIECASSEASQLVYDTIPGERDSDEDHLKFLEEWKKHADEDEEVASMRFRGPRH